MDNMDGQNAMTGQQALTRVRMAARWLMKSNRPYGPKVIAGGLLEAANCFERQMQGRADMSGEVHNLYCPKEAITPAEKYDQELALVERALKIALQQLEELRIRVYRDMPPKKPVDLEAIFPKDF